ncbi:methyltransferase, partial [Erwinia amylovora]|uniref:methyltransferase n=1 Tax=Erwinia amylovora TaxID=552 RepID=UPI0037BFB814
LASFSPNGRRTLTDVNAAASASSQAPLAANQLEGDVFASNVRSDISGRYDMIMYNKPYHDEVQTSLYYAQKLILGAVSHLNTGG